MRRRLAVRTALVGAFVIGSVFSSTGLAGAATILQPGPSTVMVANAPMTVVASGFTPGSLVYVEQCDGLPSTAKGWDVTIDCDNGASPPAAIADARGQAAFPADKPNRAFRAFQGESPSSLFNCIAPGSARPANTLPTFSNCQLRVSSNNTTVTDDQVFEPIVLSGRSVPLPAATTSTTAPSPASKRGPSTRRTGAAPGGHTPAGRSTTSSTARGNAGESRPDGPERAAASASPASTSAPGSASGGAGVLALSDGAVAAGYLLVATGLLLAVVAALLTARRRNRPATDSVTRTETAGERT
jgi:hypothetical protein